MAAPRFFPARETSERVAVVQLTGMDESNLLHEANIPTSIQPYFESEQRALPDGATSLSAGNTTGGFVFALMPATSYNIARRSALEGEPLFEMIALRSPPSDAPVNADGSINIRAFMEQGFVWPERLENPFGQAAVTDGELGVAQQALLSTILSDLARGFAESASAVETFFTDLFGEVRRALEPSTAEVTFVLTISSPDADWEPRAPLRRAWGPGRGEVIRMQGLKVYADEVGFPASTRRRLGSDHRVSMTLLRGHVYRFCVVNRLGLGGTIDFWFPTETCTGGSIIPRGASTATLNITLAEQDLQAITVAADGLAFLNNFQLPVRQPVISTGNQAGATTPGRNGYVIGLGGHDPGTLLASTALDGLIGTLAPALFPVRAALNVDIVWPDGNPSRVVFAHEFGHHVFYQLLNLFNPLTPERFALHLLTIMGGTLTNFVPGPNEPAFQPMAINEGFADVISSQLAGGTNRFPAFTEAGNYSGDGRGTGGDGVQEAYCNPAAAQPG